MTENRIVLNMYLAQSKQDIGRDITDQMQPVCRGWYAEKVLQRDAYVGPLEIVSRVL